MASSRELFKQQVRKILSSRCLKCHGGETVESEFSLADRAALLKGGAAGVAVVPGKSGESLLIKLIRHADEPSMPYKEEKLSAEAIDYLARWIDLGAAYDAPLLENTADAAAWTHKVVPPEAKKFWAYQPLSTPTPAGVRNSAWPQTAIDQFVLARLEEAKLAPNARASRRQLIRRAYFDLIGLPPSPAEVEAFVANDSPDAYGKLVDQLLASPHYGERWGRHWLDIARFAESHGFEHDSDRPTAYHYRDFVIQALNQDLPYDSFVKWQIAGDSLEPANPLAMAATGFLAAGVHSTQITKREVEKHRYDEMDDMLATVGTSMLGLTIGCARCHDHKFDAIPQRDYYQMLATFTKTVRSEPDVVVNSDEHRQLHQQWKSEHEPLVAARKKTEIDLAMQFPEWLKTADLAAIPRSWVDQRPTTSKSAGGATFIQLDDDSLRVTDANAKRDTYTFTIETSLKEIRAIRLEALADPLLAKHGPGRAPNGNFALSDFAVTAAHKKTEGDTAKAASPLPGQPKLVRARATFEQDKLPVAAAIDSDKKSAWAVDPQFGQNHAAVFDFEKPLGDGTPVILTVTLKFDNNDFHNLGRVRFSLATADIPTDLHAAGVSEALWQAAQTPAAERTAAHVEALGRWHRSLDATWQKQTAAIDAHLNAEPQPKRVKMLVSGDGVPAVRLHTQGEDFLPQTHFLRRGDCEQKQAVAAPSFLQTLMPEPDGQQRWQLDGTTGKPVPPRQALATWLTDVDHGAGHLLARVIVNRLWQHHFGRGIVGTPGDFGERGERPTHPELLDWLAGELIRQNWRLKPIHRVMMTSAAYMQDSARDPAKLAVDRENRLVWRRPARRLEAEVIRDSLLESGGLLDKTLLGPGTLSETSKRRSIYFTVKRSQLVGMMQVFDGPDALQGIAERPQTTIAPQALLLLNSSLVRNAARGLARRAATPEYSARPTSAPDEADERAKSVRRAYLTAFARAPSEEETTDSLTYLQSQTEAYRAAGKTDAAELAFTNFCHTLLLLNEFVYID